MNLIFRSVHNPHSHLTVKDRTQASFPLRNLLSRGLINGRVLDFGCGLGADVNHLKKQGHDVTGYDPYYAPNVPKGKFDTIICLYVLNVLLPDEQSHVLMAISELLYPTGSAYFAVRRDIRRDGFRNHVKYHKNVYQCQVTLPYKSILRTDHCEIYRYRHFNQLQVNESCSFCAPASNCELLTESANAYAVLENSSSLPGYTLVIPKRHVSYFDLSLYDRNACWQVVDRVKMLLSERFHPDGFRVKVGQGIATECAGWHGCIHVIPC
ncbi:HIT family protein [Roseiflexus castenholzii]|jgi:diadenosine tetraphosphate (Ap4A) HIT family hydrolase|uniref:Histidine triad (HIT) protein n=1 Tax=Roseiflexus castenholzii (strain DSM 13941 / HLO8) TaxID=383372 RepID=A7NHL0_ROSCS|nr:HIT family protein [Roseiflexus castenholzii]ABU56957.1 histidine triad (HIT) protein [Roseiflexus castenholzii DSM 13941]